MKLKPLVESRRLNIERYGLAICISLFIITLFVLIFCWLSINTTKDLNYYYSILKFTSIINIISFTIGNSIYLYKKYRHEYVLKRLVKIINENKLDKGAK